MCLWRLGRDGKALRELNRALESDENHHASHSFFAQYHCGKGAFHEALPFAEKAYALLPHFKLSATLLAGILVRTGDTARATEMLAKLGPPTAFGVSRALAQFYSITGEIEKAADWCERAIKEGDGNVAVGTTFPLYKPLRESPRWPQLAKMMNLPEGV